MENDVLILVRDETARLEEQRDEIAETLRELSQELRDLRARVREGDLKDSQEAGKLLGHLRYWLKAANETEAQLAEQRRKRAGISGAYGLDLDRARVDIGCRLDRIRRCCGEGELPE